MALLELRSVTKRFGGLTAVDGLDLEVPEGEIRGLIGPNGAGKTTLFNIITGFFPPTHGKVLFRGEDITGRRPSDIARKGLVRTFQLGVTFRDFTVQKNMMVACHLYPHDAKQKAMELLEFTGISHLKDVLAANLTHGQQKILGLAIALAVKPRLLLLDEPATGLNPEEVSAMTQMITKIRDQRITMIIIEHHMKLIMSISDKVTVINFGKRLTEGSPQEVANNRECIECYLGSEWDVAA